jgi:hypothetical protein
VGGPERAVRGAATEGMGMDETRGKAGVGESWTRGAAPMSVFGLRVLSWTAGTSGFTVLEW